MLELVRVNKMDACYLRPIVLRGYGDIGVYGQKNPVDVFVACWEWGKYLGEEALAQGVDVCVSSWSRMAPNTLPALAKAGANYMNSQLMKMEAIANGYTEGIASRVMPGSTLAPRGGVWILPSRTTKMFSPLPS